MIWEILLITLHSGHCKGLTSVLCQNWPEERLDQHVLPVIPFLSLPFLGVVIAIVRGCQRGNTFPFSSEVKRWGSVNYTDKRQIGKKKTKFIHLLMQELTENVAQRGS